MKSTYVSTRQRKEKYQVNQVLVVWNQMSKVDQMYLRHFSTLSYDIGGAWVESPLELNRFHCLKCAIKRCWENPYSRIFYAVFIKWTNSCLVCGWLDTLLFVVSPFNLLTVDFKILRYFPNFLAVSWAQNFL